MIGILDPARYAAVNARVRGRLDKLISITRWGHILTASDLPDLVRWLHNTVYWDVLAPIGEAEVEPERVERALRQYHAQAFRMPLSFLRGAPANLLDWLWRGFEVDNIKTVLRTVERGVARQQIRASLTPLGPASGLPWDELADSPSVPAVVDRLNSTFYGRALDQALDRYRREQLLFVLEVALDLAYYRRLRRLLDDLGGRDKAEAERFVGFNIDAQNLQWAYRYRIYFDLSPEEILNYTLPRGLRVDASVVREIATGWPLLEIATRLWGDRLPDLERLRNRSEREALPELELIFQRHLYQEARGTLRGDPLHFGVVLAYETLLESEVEDLVTVVEGKEAGWSVDRIRSYLIGSRG